MSAIYIMDSCALIALSQDETGADAVANIIMVSGKQLHQK